MTEITHALIIDAPFDFTGNLALLIPIIAVSLPAIIWPTPIKPTNTPTPFKISPIAIQPSINKPAPIKMVIIPLLLKSIGEILKVVGVLVGLIGVGQMVAGYVYPNQSEEINKVVEEFEKK